MYTKALIHANGKSQGFKEVLQELGLTVYSRPVNAHSRMLIARTGIWLPGGTIVISRLRNRALQKSVDEFWRLASPDGQTYHMVYPPKGVIFEGSADALFYGEENDVFVCGYGQRTNRDGARFITDVVYQRTGRQFEALKLTSKYFCRLALCFRPIGNDLLWYPSAFAKQDQGVVRDMVREWTNQRDPMDVTAKDAYNFACSGIPLRTREGKWVYLSNAISDELQRTLKNRGITPIIVPTQNHQKYLWCSTLLFS
jgi:N-dimethylarginine dimethylaminohydrolase